MKIRKSGELLERSARRPYRSRSLAAVILLVTLSGVPLPARADGGKDSEGLPPTLSADYTRQERLIPFNPPSDSPAPLIAAGIQINGKPAPGNGRSLFHIEAYATLPPGTAIEVTPRPLGQKEFWTYPVGTESVHELRFESSDALPFELRIARLVREGRWAVGSYHWDGTQWVLNDYEGLKPETFVITHPRLGQIQVALKRISLRSCKGCHATRVDPEQFPTRDETGPCGFVPENPGLRTDWAGLFVARLGEEPFRALSRP